MPGRETGFVLIARQSVRHSLNSMGMVPRYRDLFDTGRFRMLYLHYCRSCGEIAGMVAGMHRKAHGRNFSLDKQSPIFMYYSAQILDTIEKRGVIEMKTPRYFPSNNSV